MVKKKKSTEMGLAKEKMKEPSRREMTLTTARIKKSALARFKYVCDLERVDLTDQLSVLAQEWADKKHRSFKLPTLEEICPEED